jgi:hypothetical protein
VKAKHLEFAAEDHVPIGLHGIDLKPSVDNRIAWSDVGGLTHAKKIIVETLKWPTQVCKLSFFSSFGLRLVTTLPFVILMYSSSIQSCSPIALLDYDRPFYSMGPLELAKQCWLALWLLNAKSTSSALRLERHTKNYQRYCTVCLISHS